MHARLQRRLLYLEVGGEGRRLLEVQEVLEHAPGPLDTNSLGVVQDEQRGRLRKRSRDERLDGGRLTAGRVGGGRLRGGR